MCEYRFLFLLCQNVVYYCTALSEVFDWVCALYVLLVLLLFFLIIVFNYYFLLMPSENFLQHQKPGRRIRPRKDSKYNSTNPIYSFVRSGDDDRCFTAPTSQTEQFKNSLSCHITLRFIGSWPLACCYK